MAWLLIRAFSDDAATAWKLGDIVEVRPDDCAWGTQEGLPKFYRVQITAIPSDRIKSRLEQADTGALLPGGYRVLRRVRKYLLRVADVPAAIRNQLQTTGIVTVTRNQIANYLRDNDGNLANLD